MSAFECVYFNGDCSKCAEEYGKNSQMHGADSLIEREDIEKLLQSGEGCRLEGHLEVNKIAGNFHIGKILG